MSEPFLAEIKMFGFNFAPRGYAACDGQTLPINQNQSLFALVGTTYGGDGRTTFGLPELRGRVPIHVGSSGGASHSWGQKSGEEAHLLTSGQVPTHGHDLKASSTNGDAPVPEGGMLAAYLNGSRDGTNPVALPTEAVSNTGGGGHNNMQPVLAIGFAIALQGLFPSRN